MKYFKLPDLGEGLQEAEIAEWHIKEGDSVAVDQPLVSVETAKAIVNVPSPQEGTIAHLFGGVGDILHIGEPLVEFAGEAQEDAGTVVGEIAQGEPKSQEDHFIIGAAKGNNHRYVKATPAVRALAKRYGIDLNFVKPGGRDGMVTHHDVELAAKLWADKGEAEPLRGVRRTMAKNMSRSHEEVVPVSIYEDVDIHRWPQKGDPTIRLVHAIGEACRQEPALNVWFDSHTQSRRLLEQVDVGIAVDTEDGLFVPVLRNVRKRLPDDLRNGLNQMRKDLKTRIIPAKEMLNPTITLSNFGTMSGRYANPVVIPPTVAIIGSGVIREQAVAWKGEVVIHPVLPLSLTFDHRVVTGGEAACFLGVMQSILESPTESQTT